MLSWHAFQNQCTQTFPITRSFKLASSSRTIICTRLNKIKKRNEKEHAHKFRNLLAGTTLVTSFVSSTMEKIHASTWDHIIDKGLSERNDYKANKTLRENIVRGILTILPYWSEAILPTWLSFSVFIALISFFLSCKEYDLEVQLKVHFFLYLE